MARVPEPIDIDDVPELVRLADQVRDSWEPCLLRREGEIVAALVPRQVAEDLGLPWPLSAEDVAAFQSAAGGWKDVDTDKLIEDISARRGRPVRPSVER